MKYFAFVGIVTMAFFIVYGIFALIEKNSKQKSKRKGVDRKAIAYQPTWVSYEYKRKPELEEFEAMEKMERK